MLILADCKLMPCTLPVRHCLRSGRVLLSSCRPIKNTGDAPQKIPRAKKQHDEGILQMLLSSDKSQDYTASLAVAWRWYVHAVAHAVQTGSPGASKLERKECFSS